MHANHISAALSLTILLPASLPLAVHFHAGTGQTKQQATPTPAKPGEVRLNATDGLNYAWIPAGKFLMGCSPNDSQCDADEMRAHAVTITRGFWMGQTEVTVRAFKRFAATGNAMPNAPTFNPGWANESMPVVRINWTEAQSYCQWAGGRLPTEAEWEYAARGGNTEARPGGLDDIAWYEQNSGHQAHDVAQKRANEFGLYDMLGNVWEWVSDWYDADFYAYSRPRDPAGPGTGDYRVLRGGSWDFSSKSARVSARSFYDPAFKNFDAGVRCIGPANLP